MKFLHGFGNLKATTAASTQDMTGQDVAEDEVTDEALLEAIVGTSNPNCVATSGASRTPANSLGHRHRHKHV